DGMVRMEVYNVKGQKIRTLVNENMPAGTYQAIWNGTDDHNRKVASGIYFYKMISGKYTSTKKMILMK
ncbi:MAG: T9SS type A sorting domain-containing protein, partial [Candidatus Cloacimonetes bacterium]|nr:T9SS type A sorting domain-containing protein [Candidatus Cloacimonadota bacterium]